MGYPEPCTACGKEALVSIVIEQGTLQSVHFRSSFPWDPDTVLKGVERIGSDGALRHGAWFSVMPSHPGSDLRSMLTRQEETLLSEPLSAHILVAWSEGSVALRATRDAHGRCITEWSQNPGAESSLPHPLAQRLQAVPILSAHLGEERAALRIASLPSAIAALSTLYQSHPALAPKLVHAIALGILAGGDWRFAALP